MGEKMSWSRPIRINLEILHLKELNKKKLPEITEAVIDESNIILEVLDARFINETRNLDYEKIIREKKKKIIYILNKVDLIDVKALKKKNEIQHLKPYALISVTRKMGIDDLRKKLIMEAKKFKFENEKVVVGIIGYPNTGKSSLINALTRRGASKISKEAGFTRARQKVALGKDVVLLDTPGIISEKEYSNENKNSLAMQVQVGARGYDNIRDPEDVVAYLMEKYPGVIEKFYKVKSENDINVLLEEVGKKKKFMKKKGEVNTDRTARFVIKEWQEGSIKLA